MNITIQEIRKVYEKGDERYYCIGAACVRYCFIHAEKKSPMCEMNKMFLNGVCGYPFIKTLGEMMSDFSDVPLKTSMKIAKQVVVLNDTGRQEDAWAKAAQWF